MAFLDSSGNEVKHVSEASRPIAAGDTGTAAANTQVQKTFTPGSGKSIYIGGLYWSYAGGTPAGSLTITDNGTTVFQADITANGVNSLLFPQPIKFSTGNAVIVTLSAGGASITGKLNVRNWTE
jgi:hypothetical protein